MDVSIHPNENLLNEVLGLLAIADRPVDEVQKTRLIAFDDLLERALLASEKRSDYRSVIQGPKPFSRRHTRQRRTFNSDLSHR